MSLRVYNDLTQRKEEFVPLEPGKVRFYNCGPTVYDYFHIGNARAFTVADTVRRYLTWRGYQVTFVQNFTDIDDKMINRARERGISVGELADEMIAAYQQDARSLNLLPPDVSPRATEHIAEMVAMVERLIAKGYAYASGGDVYFRVRAFSHYGCLSHRNLDDLRVGARIEVDERKDDPLDFVLWKAQKPGEPAWDSPWGPGRPGWHLECSVMARKYLGDTLDLHSGGEDLVFPHHENEIAQSEAAVGEPFSRYWLHNAFLNIDGEKMSKSLGNFKTVRDLAAHFDPEVVRFYLLSAHYRTQLNFTAELLESAERALARLYTAEANLRHLAETAPVATAETDAAVLAELGKARERFIEAMDDDFNTGNAQAALFDLAKDLNSRTGAGTSANLAEGGRQLLLELAGVLGLMSRAGKESATLDEEVQSLVDQRIAARKARNFAEADRLRDQLAAMGITLEDTPQGVRWRRK